MYGTDTYIDNVYCHDNRKTLGDIKSLRVPFISRMG